MTEIRNNVMYGMKDTVQFQDLQFQLETLLLRGLDKGTLSIAIENMGIEVVVAKIFETQNNAGLEIFVRGARDVPILIDEIRAHAHKMTFSEIINGTNGAICKVYGEGIVEKMHKLLGFVFFEMLRLQNDERFPIRMDKISPWPEEISSPFQLPTPRRKAIELLKNRARDKYGLGTVSIILLLFLTAIHWAGVLGLLSVLFVFRDGGGPINISIIGNVIRIPFAGGLFMLAICVGIVGTMAVFLRTYWAEPIGAGNSGFVSVARRIIGHLANFLARPPIWGSILLVLVSVVVWNF